MQTHIRPLIIGSLVLLLTVFSPTCATPSIPSSAFAQMYEPTWESVDRRRTPIWFSEARFGIFIHWGTYSVPAYAPVIPGKLAYAEWYWHAMTNGRDNPKAGELEKGTWAFHQRVYGSDIPYQNFAPQFKAELFDPDHWAEVFANSGAKYVVLTSKHHEGFTLWPSKDASRTWGRHGMLLKLAPSATCLAICQKLFAAKACAWATTIRFTSGTTRFGSLTSRAMYRNMSSRNSKTWSRNTGLRSSSVTASGKCLQQTGTHRNCSHGCSTIRPSKTKSSSMIAFSLGYPFNAELSPRVDVRLLHQPPFLRGSSFAHEPDSHLRI